MKTIVDIYPNAVGAITRYSVREWSINICAVERFVLEGRLTDEQKKILSASGVYILANSERVYVGQSRNILTRWGQHISNDEKDWFDCAYAITDMRDFSATDLNALEYLFHEKACEAKRFEVTNSQTTENQKNDYFKDKDFYDTIFSNVNLLLNSIYRGHRIFDSIAEVESTSNDVRINNNEDFLDSTLQDNVFFLKVNNGQARLKKVKEGWLLLKGSQTQKYDLQSYADGSKKRILKVCSCFDGKLDSDLKTTEDIIFTAPSTAAMAVRQQAQNGWWEWKDESGKPLSNYKSVFSE